MKSYREESEERTVRRFEAFSDIVIGFSLAQLGVSLVLPGHAADLFTDPGWLVSFLWAFAMICAMWWFHHRIFSTIFVPRTVPVLLNFVWLALVVLCVYATQITAHFPQEPASWQMYFVLFALAYGLLAVQYYLGIRAGADALPSDMLLAARRQGSFMALWSAAFFVSSLFMFVLPWGQPVGISIWVTMFTASVASGVLARRFRKMREAQAAQQ
jgi:uncharacterized membrane protein